MTTEPSRRAAAGFAAPPSATPADGTPAIDRDTLVVANEALAKGFTMIPNAVLRAQNLSRDAKLLYGILLSYAWQTQSCWPGHERLAHDLQASPKSVRGWVRELEGVGMLKQKRRGQGLSNVYTLFDPVVQIGTTDRSRTVKTTDPEQEGKNDRSRTVKTTVLAQKGKNVPSGSVVRDDPERAPASDLDRAENTGEEDPVDKDPEEERTISRSVSRAGRARPDHGRARQIDHGAIDPDDEVQPLPRRVAARPRSGSIAPRAGDRPLGEPPLARHVAARPRAMAIDPVAGVGLGQLWHAALSDLRLRMTPPLFETWVKNTSLVGATESTATIAAPNTFAREWLETRFRAEIEMTLGQIRGRPTRIDVIVEGLTDR